MVPSRIRFHCATTGTPSDVNFKLQNKFTFCSNSVGVSTLDAYYIYCAYLFYTDFPWHTIAIVLGIVCFFLLLTTTVLGYICKYQIYTFLREQRARMKNEIG